MYKLNDKGSTDPIWDLHDNYIDYNKDKTGQLIKCIEENGNKYIVILMEKVLEEFAESHYGYIRINMTI